jgi:hypothetical protein
VCQLFVKVLSTVDRTGRYAIQVIRQDGQTFRR